MKNEIKCPSCKKKATKVIYMGLPMRLCDDTENCSTLFGFWSFIVLITPFNGVFLTYTGSYWSALKIFIKGDF